MSKLNKEWHLANKMPNPPVGGPTVDQRIAWHTEHAKNCTCWPIPQKLLDQINQRNLAKEV